MKFCHVSLLTLFFLLSTLQAQTQTQTLSYTASQEDIVNPDRGFYHPIYPAGDMNNFTPIDAADLISKRQTFYTPFSASYQIRTGLFYRYYILDNSTDDLSSFTPLLQQDFDAVRQAGARLIIRFVYTVTPDTSCGASACPPYGDASKARVLTHITQLKPILQANEDVIATVQNGFIGVWGEQYYTDYFGDASQSPYKLLDNNWQDRIDVLAALLDATPASRAVQARYPQMKQKYIYGINAPVTSAAMTAAQAHTGTDLARLGFHNDCFLAASDDFGTYWDYGSSTTSSSDQTAFLKPYAAADGKYVPVGGETCSDGYSPENDCSGIAVSDMAALHYSFLNSEYNNDVNNDWETDNCMDEIKQKLGYRLVMLDGTYPLSAAAGTSMSFTLNLENVGFAAPYNERELELVLRNVSTLTDYKVSINGANTDTRLWHTGTIAMTANITLPTTLPIGSYDLLLHILDPSNNNAVADRPEYSIQLANVGTWEASTGFNQLNHLLIVTTAPPTPSCVTIDGDFSDWSSISNISTSGSTGLNTLKAADETNTLYVQAATDINTNYQLYLDSDNDSSGSNEYTNTNWSSTGFNFMIENGTLYAYTGTGADWSWSFVATLNAIKNGSGLELEIDKSLLGASLSTINIALATLDANWNEVGYIPTGSIAAPYTLNSMLDCGGCTSDDLILQGVLSSNEDYETNGTITSTQTISGNNTVDYDSKTSILMNVGFSTSNTVDFSAFIDGCGGQFRTESSDEKRQPHQPVSE